MADTVFITGAGGFVGRSLVPRLVSQTGRCIKILLRRADSDFGLDEASPEVVVGDLLNAPAYQAALEGVDTVVHLAAVTGRAHPAEYARANVEATRTLLEACKTAGVRQFFHVSTIAATYPDKRYSPYAKTKAEAEKLVGEAGIAFTIVRPTIVLGARSPIWSTLSKIATLPVIPLPQGTGPVSVQPIHVDDVVRAIILVMDANRFEGETFDLGGPRALRFADFLDQIHQAARGKRARIFPVPVAPIRMLLALVEPVFRPLMPVTAGQLAVFAFDSTVTPNWLHDQLRDAMPSSEEMIAGLIAEPSDPAGGAGTGAEKQQPRPIQPPSDAAKRILADECRHFSRYLIGATPSAYVSENYIQAATAHAIAIDGEFAKFDRFVLAFARNNRMFTRWADAYCAIFRRGGVLRRKLIVLSAILEHVAPTNKAFDEVRNNGPLSAIVKLVAVGSTFGLSLIFGMLILLPARLACGLPLPASAKGPAE